MVRDSIKEVTAFADGGGTEASLARGCLRLDMICFGGRAGFETGEGVALAIESFRVAVFGSSFIIASKSTSPLSSSSSSNSISSTLPRNHTASLSNLPSIHPLFALHFFEQYPSSSFPSLGLIVRARVEMTKRLDDE